MKAVIGQWQAHLENQVKLQVLGLATLTFSCVNDFNMCA